ncbi:WD40-repeat-containing domain protein [Crepidotus variabilis]|uniref:WD40-repeat-containing domain protein n=1 Tax=Crepidotus variabilis TaxID=179855 RepID=A0A9P6E732_9AGAR|nr:WD40-repeat-containing domain protein [Crepidotus variabilis]
MQPSQINISLPVISIQPSFPEVLQEIQDGVIPFDKFWVSCYKSGETSTHAKVLAELDETDRNLVLLKPVNEDGERDDDSVQIEGENGVSTVGCTKMGIPSTRVLSSKQNYHDNERSTSTRPQRITGFDVAPDSSRFATGYLDGSVYLYPTSSYTSTSTSHLPQSIDVTNKKTISKPHLSTVTSLKFFPSSRVLLCSGQDFSLSILPAGLPDDSGSPVSFGTRITPARTMRGHTRAVTGTGIIGVGRNIVSTSRDTMVKLWDVPSGEVITTLFAKGSIASMSLGDRTPIPPDGEVVTPPKSNDDREVSETKDKMVFCGLENGSFQQFDLGFKKSVYISPSMGVSSISSMAYSTASHLLATGTAAGIVTLYDTRSITTPLTSFSRMQAGVEDLAFLPGGYDEPGEVNVAVATSDGLPFVAGVIPEGPTVNAELVGVDCDPVRHVLYRDCEGKRNVWTASDDGLVRRYVV